MKDIERLLNNPELSIREAENPLARLLRSMWADEGITPLKFNDLLNKWLDGPYSGVRKDHPGHRSTTRGNFLDAIKSPRITFEIFMRGVQMLDPNGIELTVGVEWTSRHKTIHSVNVPFKGTVEAAGVSTTSAVTPVAIKRRWSGRYRGPESVKPAGFTNLEYKDKEDE